VPPAPDALHRYQQDLLAGMRQFVVRLRDLEQKVDGVLGRKAKDLVQLEKMGLVGHDLVEYAYDENDGDLLNPDAEDIVDAIDNGILPDLDDARRAILDPLRDLIADTVKRMAQLADIEAPRNGMVRVMTDERRARQDDQ
jgi:hypothetical protein